MRENRKRDGEKLERKEIGDRERMTEKEVVAQVTGQGWPLEVALALAKKEGRDRLGRG